MKTMAKWRQGNFCISILLVNQYIYNLLIWIRVVLLSGITFAYIIIELTKCKLYVIGLF